MIVYTKDTEKGKPCKWYPSWRCFHDEVDDLECMACINCHTTQSLHNIFRVNPLTNIQNSRLIAHSVDMANEAADAGNALLEKVRPEIYEKFNRIIREQSDSPQLILLSMKEDKPETAVPV